MLSLQQMIVLTIIILSIGVISGVICFVVDYNIKQQYLSSIKFCNNSTSAKIDDSEVPIDIIIDKFSLIAKR